MVSLVDPSGVTRRDFHTTRHFPALLLAIVCPVGNYPAGTVSANTSVVAEMLRMHASHCAGETHAVWSDLWCLVLSEPWPQKAHSN
eukprot:6456239-Amphidinium_carterae.1